MCPLETLRAYKKDRKIFHQDLQGQDKGRWFRSKSGSHHTGYRQPQPLCSYVKEKVYHKNTSMLKGWLQLNTEQSWFPLLTALAEHFLSFPGFVRLYLEPESDPKICSVEVLQVSTLGQEHILFLLLVNYNPVASIPSTVVLLQLEKAGHVVFLQFS